MSTKAKAAAAAALNKPQRQSQVALMNRHCFFTDRVMPWLGTGLAALIIVPFAFQIVICTTLGFIFDKSGLNALIGSIGNHKFWHRFVTDKVNGQIAAWALWLSVFIPAYCLYELWHAWAFGFSWKRAIIYNIIRIGPMYMNFAHVYALSHKEYHKFNGIFTDSLNSWGVGRVFNWWIGMFFGVLPGTFTHSHVYNHHKYDNNIDDQYSTGGYARDSLWNFARYIFVWFMYASNLSTIMQFTLEGRNKWALQVLGCVTYYLAFVRIFYALSPMWCFVSVVWAFFEGNLLLSVINWVWHAFIDPEAPDNEFTNSTTIVHGEHFIFHEEYHVVHHQNGGAHWPMLPLRFEEDWKAGKYKSTIVFKNCNLFVLGGMILFQDYKGMLQFVHDPEHDHDPKTLEATIRDRLRCTVW